MRTVITRRRLVFFALLLPPLVALFVFQGPLQSAVRNRLSSNSLNLASVAAPAGIAGKTVYLGTNGGVVALDARTGATRWRYPAAGVAGDGVTTSGSPRVTDMALCDGTLYAALINGPIVALRASDGARMWSSSVVSASNTPGVACASGIVYAAAHVGTPQAASDRLLVALRASDGHELWRIVAGEPILSAPAVAAGDVVFGTTDRLLYVVNGQTGALVWRSPAYSVTGGGAHPEGYNQARPVGISIVAQGGTVYINAKIKRTNSAGHSSIEPQTEMAQVNVPNAFVGIMGLPPEGLPAAYPPVVAGGVSYAEGGGGIWALGTTGDNHFGWFHLSNGTQYTGPALGDGRLYVCAFNGETYAMSAKDGHDLWQAQTLQSANLSQPPAFAGGALFVAGGSTA